MGSGDSERLEQEVDHSTNEFRMGSGRPSDQTPGRKGSIVEKLKGKVGNIFHSDKNREKAEKRVQAANTVLWYCHRLYCP